MDDVDNVKKENNYVIKIHDSFFGCNLSLFINIRKTQEEKIELCVRSKKNGLVGFDESKVIAISFIKRHISFDIFGKLI